MIKFNNSLKIIEDFHFYYSDKLRSKKLAAYKSEKKKVNNQELFFVICSKDFLSQNKNNI